VNRKEIFTIPNILGFYRLLMFPVILWFALSGRELLFAIFLIINLLTDVADGIIARRFHMETEFGAKLDSFADNFNYLLAMTGIFVFKLEEFMPHIASFIIFLGFLFLSVIFSLFKFRKFPSFHLYSTKIGGYIQGAFLICLFTIGFITPFYYFMILWTIVSQTEHIAIQIIIPEMRSNVKGLYWVLGEHRKKKLQSQ
jgi:cardiolipin synthase (CMP-forming)